MSINRNSPSDGLSRTNQKLGVLTARQQATMSIVATAVLAAVLWHVMLVLLAGVPIGQLNVTVHALTALHPLGGLRPRYEPPSTGVALLVWLGLLVLTGGAWAALRMRLSGRRKHRAVGMADRRQARQSVGEIRARELAAYTRRTSVASGALNPETAPLAEVGFELGRKHDDGEPIIMTLEDQMAVFAPTGGGKSLHLMIPGCIDAPGPLVATATSPEILDAIVEPRSGMGRIWVFDPLDTAKWPEPMIWNPVAGAENSEQAVSRGQAFTAGFSADESSDSSNPFFRNAAGIIIARLLHAASLVDRPVEDVLGWALDLERSTEARDILNSEAGAEIMWGRTLEAAVQGADETLSSVRMTLAQKVEPLLSRKVLRQMTPTPGVPVFDPLTFVQSRDTLVLITDDQADTNVAPLSTMLLNEVLSAAKRYAAAAPGGRLDPPLRIIGDEISNVAPLPKLPGLISNSRGFGVQWWLAFQSMAQILSRWGEGGGRALMANLNLSLILGGLQDEQALERFSVLVGSADLVQVSASMDAGNTVSGHSLSTTERRILPPEKIRQLPDGRALVIYRNAPAMIVDLIPWTGRQDGPDIAAGIKRIRSMRMSHPTAAVPAPSLQTSLGASGHWSGR